MRITRPTVNCGRWFSTFVADREKAGLLISTAVVSESIGDGASESEVVFLDSFDMENDLADIVGDVLLSTIIVQHHIEKNLILRTM